MSPINPKVNVNVSDSCNNCCRCCPWSSKPKGAEKETEIAQSTASPESIEIDEIVIEERRMVTTHIHIPPAPNQRNVPKK